MYQGELKYLISVVYPAHMGGEKWLDKERDTPLEFTRQPQLSRGTYDNLQQVKSLMEAIASAQLDQPNLQDISSNVLRKVALIGQLSDPTEKSIRIDFRNDVWLRLYKAMIDEMGIIRVLEKEDFEVAVLWTNPEPNYNLGG